MGFSLAFEINSRAQVMGWSDTSSGHSHAFLWQSGSGMQDLGTLPGLLFSIG
jgi:probable HAF family extracellular repeat protein